MNYQDSHKYECWVWRSKRCKWVEKMLFIFWIFVDNINWQFPRWHTLTRHRASVCLSRHSILRTFTSFSHHFRCSVHTLCYTSKLTFCPKHFKTCKDKSESNKDLTSGTRHFYNIWPNTEHLKHLSSKINLSWTLEIRYHLSSILENLVIALYLDCADWVMSAGCHMLAIAELRPRWEHSQCHKILRNKQLHIHIWKSLACF